VKKEEIVGSVYVINNKQELDGPRSPFLDRVAGCSREGLFSTAIVWQARFYTCALRWS